MARPTGPATTGAGGTEPAGVAVVVPTHDRAPQLARLLEALELAVAEVGDGSGVAVEVVVVDDASTDGTPGLLAAWAAAGPGRRAMAIGDPVEGPVGPAAARNAGWRSTTAAIVAFTDDDTAPTPGWLVAHLAAFAADPALGVAQGRTTRPDDLLPGERSAWREVHGPSPWFEGCNLAVRRVALEQAGGFDERRRMDGEDTALGWRVVEAGWGRGFVAGAEVVHDVADRPLRWHLRSAWREHVVVDLAADHPGLRTSLWRPWCVRPGDLGDIGLVVSLCLAPMAFVRPAHRAARLAVAAALASPWLARRHVPATAAAPGQLLGRAARDVVGVAGRIVGSIRRRVVVL